ncbi:MAG: phenylalanine--tRNA ligase subunit beta [Acidobacteria bacterium 13_1_40CM_2_64_6]|nr:MAG: phenylalanine--tRNA ligase subunit beta [Acidobacteria bacterium 13_1_40CM_3_65_5]OLD57604.1 MAG: phenylalanine--tRNA ligase subunit beta [Acidobacteria bacterium 13_1_40CM_2_64_6]
MRLVLSWLREFVDVSAPAEEIAEKVGLRGFEVASIEKLDDGDAVIDFEITANRPDCLSVLGLAREVATVYDKPITLPSSDPRAKIALKPVTIGSSDRVKVTIDDAELCPRYAAAVADVKIGPAPAWMTARLHAAGVRPISTIVDITNYVNVEIGQPMHAFDLAKLAGPEIRVRRAKPGETIRTLDGIDRKLEADMLVIADRDRAQAIAGVMGGAASEVSASTKLVVYESAYFKPASVRRTSKRLGLKTEASSRFERGADIGAQVVALQRAIALMEQIGAGTAIGPVIDCYPQPRSPKTLHLRRDRLTRLLGVSVPDAEVVRILTRLGLRVTSTPDGWDAVAPTFRVDLLREVDLIEEVGRHYGFDRLEATFPVVTTAAPPPDPRILRDRLVRRVLTAAGLSEAVTFGFIEAKAAEPFATAGHASIAVANPLSAKFDTLRPSLLPGLVDAVAHNRRHGRSDVRLFEIGTRFAADGETRGVAVAWTGNGSGDHWSGGSREVDFFDVKGIVEQLCGVLRVPVDFQPASESYLMPGQTASLIVAGGPARGEPAGLVGQLQPAIADARGLPSKDRVYVGELNLDVLSRARVAASDATRPLPRHPSVVRDLSIVVPDTLPAAIIRGTIQSAARVLAAPLVSISFFDRYQGKGVPSGSVSVSVRLTFQADDRTLTDAEVQQSFDTILAALVRDHGAVQR